MELEHKSSDRMQDMVDDGRFSPLLNATKETNYTRILKYVMNFGMAVIQLINIPLFIFALLATVEVVIKWTADSEFTFGGKVEWLLYLLGGMAVLKQLIQKTRANIVSHEVQLIWALNFVSGSVKNGFVSLEEAEKYSKKLEDFVEYNAKKYAEARERELLGVIEQLENDVQRISETTDFPDDALQSFARVVQFSSKAIIDPENPRSHLNVVMDRLLGEIASLKMFGGLVHQASVMVLGPDQKTLAIVGQHNLHDNVISSRSILLGEKFAGKIVEQGKFVVINDIYAEGSQKYGFDPADRNKTYRGIAGMPIKRRGEDKYAPMGVINLHFNAVASFKEVESVQIEKCLEVYCQFIVSFLEMHRTVLRSESAQVEIGARK